MIRSLPGHRLPFRLSCWKAASVLCVLAGMLSPVRAQDGAQPYEIVGEAIPKSLTGKQGDPARGRAIVSNRQVGLCLLCHSASVIPEEKFQGDLAPDLAGAGSRWKIEELRLRIVDASRFNADTIMPAYYKTGGLTRVGTAFAGKTILTAEQIEDVVAWLATLREVKK
jgi:sulfur-oxidizing protein SoxX